MGSGLRPAASHVRQVRKDRPHNLAAVAALTSRGMPTRAVFVLLTRDFFIMMDCKKLQSVSLGTCRNDPW